MGKETNAAIATTPKTRIPRKTKKALVKVAAAAPKAN